MSCEKELRDLRRQLRAYQEFALRVEEIHASYPEGNTSWLYLAARAKLYGAERAEGLVDVQGRVVNAAPGAAEEAEKADEDLGWLE